jgi:hypothetical protein
MMADRAVRAGIAGIAIGLFAATLAVTHWHPLGRTPFERCLVGCVQTYADDLTRDAAARFANCVDRCEGE